MVYCLSTVVKPWPLSNFRTFSWHKKEILHPSAVTPDPKPLPSQFQATINLRSVSIHLYSPDCSELFMSMTSYSIYPYVSGFFCSSVFRGHPRWNMHQYSIPVYCQIFYCVNLLHFIYPFISSWTFELFLLSGYYK